MENTHLPSRAARYWGHPSGRIFAILLILVVLIQVLSGCQSTLFGRMLERYDLDFTFRPDGVSIELAERNEDSRLAALETTPGETLAPAPMPTAGAVVVPQVPAEVVSENATPENIPETLPEFVPDDLPAHSPPPEVYEASEVYEVYELDAEFANLWFDIVLDLVENTPGFSPPVAARTFGYLGITLYEALQPGMARHISLAGQLNELDSLPVPEADVTYHWPLAANRAVAQMLRYSFPSAGSELEQAIFAQELEFFHHFAEQADEATINRSMAWGEAVALTVFTWSTGDGGHHGYARNFPASYTLPEQAGNWVPTPPGYSAALLPYWGENRPFILATGGTCPAPPPVEYSEMPGSAFYNQALEVYEVGRNRSAEDILIAEFWADDPGRTATPGGHWISILRQVLEQQEADLGFASEAYARLGIALNDAFVTCWHTKYLYNVVRPITYIQEVIDPAWNVTHSMDPVGTPPFPEYTSGHSVQSGAAAAILTDLFGENFAFTDSTHVARGMAARDFPSFREAALEAAISRLYGGIHYRMAIEAGLEQGECVAHWVRTIRFRQ